MEHVRATQQRERVLGNAGLVQQFPPIDFSRVQIEKVDGKGFTGGAFSLAGTYVGRSILATHVPRFGNNDLRVNPGVFPEEPSRELSANGCG